MQYTQFEFASQYINLPGVMKTGLANNFFSQLPVSNSLFTVLFAYVVLFLACLVLRYFCRSGCRHNYYLPPPSPYFFSTHNSFFNTSDSYQFEIRGRLKLVSVPLAVKSYILVTLRKVYRRASCKALRWDKVITIRRVCIFQ